MLLILYKYGYMKDLILIRLLLNVLKKKLINGISSQSNNTLCIYIFNGKFRNFVICTYFAAGTPYAGGLFRMKLVLGKNFPSEPPKGFFTTKIFHPNVASNGEICVNTLKKDWKAELGIKHVLLVWNTVLIFGKKIKLCYQESGKFLWIFNGIHFKVNHFAKYTENQGFFAKWKKSQKNYG